MGLLCTPERKHRSGEEIGTGDARLICNDDLKILFDKGMFK